MIQSTSRLVLMRGKKPHDSGHTKWAWSQQGWCQRKEGKWDRKQTYFSSALQLPGQCLDKLWLSSSSGLIKHLWSQQKSNLRPAVEKQRNAGGMGNIKPVKYLKIKHSGGQELSVFLGTLPHAGNKYTVVTVAMYWWHEESYQSSWTSLVLPGLKKSQDSSS